MELIYRGIKYSNNDSTGLKSVQNNQYRIIYRGTSVKAAIDPKFPLLKYCQQLFSSCQSPVFDPIKFWYQHKSQYLENCWELDLIEQLNYCWTITLETKPKPSLKPNCIERPIKLKYRGVTYYR